jgi:predicted methyltransferase
LSRATTPVITPHTAKLLLDGDDLITTDLGITKNKVHRSNEGVFLNSLFVNFDTLRKIAKREDSVYFVTERGVFQVAIHEKHYYKLVPTSRAPTLEIDGIRMHRTSGTTPDIDTNSKLNALRLNEGNVLDTCTGLGYTAIEAARRGAYKVVTIELQPNVIRIAKMNPWSIELFTHIGIQKILADVFYIIDFLPNGFFDYVIHDPPRHRQARKLYSGAFYRKLSRVLRHGGKMFHYTGEPGSRYRGVNVPKGVSKRLGEAGFVDIVYHKDSMGFTCIKGSI